LKVAFPWLELIVAWVIFVFGGLGGCALVSKLAETARSLFTVNEQAPVPEHAPPQPAKVDPEAGIAVNVTLVPPA
jgi:hypothetical protein